jgi:hypothetical protein
MCMLNVQVKVKCNKNVVVLTIYWIDTYIAKAILYKNI